MLPDGRGVVHTVDCVMCCLRLLQHCRYEQVWNKTVRPSPKIAVHGEWDHQVRFGFGLGLGLGLGLALTLTLTLTLT